MKPQNKIALVPFALTFLLNLNALIQTFIIHKFIVQNTILYAAFGIICILVLILLQKNYWKHLFTIFLVVAMFQLIELYNFAFVVKIGSLYTEITAFVLLLFHLVVNKVVIKDLLELFKKSEIELEDSTERQINSFEIKFATKNKNELEKIVNENSLVPEAIEAARRLLQK